MATETHPAVKIQGMSEEPHRNLSKAVRCPKCRGRNLQLEERTPGSVTMYTQSFDQGSYTIRSDSRNQKATSETNVRATCVNCNYAWTVRGVRCVATLTYAQKIEEGAAQSPLPN